MHMASRNNVPNIVRHYKNLKELFFLIRQNVISLPCSMQTTYPGLCKRYRGKVIQWYGHILFFVFVFVFFLVRSNYTSLHMKGICFYSLCALWLWTRSLPLGASVFCATFNEESGADFVFIIYA